MTMTTATIPTTPPALVPEELDWVVESGMDPNGRLFRHAGGLHRAMTGHDADFYQRVMGVVDEHPVLRQGIVSTRISTLSVVGATAVLDHKRIEPLVLPWAWSPLMFHRAAMLHCDVHMALAESGLNLQDAHLWNVGFDKTRPVFVDFGSITDRETPKLRAALLTEYRHYLIHPLVLMARGQWGKARRYLHGSNPPLEPRDFLAYLGPLGAVGFLRRTRGHARRARRGLGEMLASIRRHVASLSPPRDSSPWDGYHDDESGRDRADWHGKQTSVASILADEAPLTVLDVGCATGWYSLLAAEGGCDVVALDSDPAMIDGVFEAAEARRLPISPVVGDIFAGPNPIEHKQFDMVLALAIVHHLVFSQGCTLDRVADALARATRRICVTEFIDDNDEFVKSQTVTGLTRYSLHEFVTRLEARFASVKRLPSSSDNRTVLLCRK